MRINIPKNIYTCPKCGHPVGWWRKYPCKNCGTIWSVNYWKRDISIETHLVPRKTTTDHSLIRSMDPALSKVESHDCKESYQNDIFIRIAVRGRTR